MSYSEPLLAQLYRFLLFLGVGFLLGFVWAVLQFLRALFGDGIRATVILDVLFCALSFFALFFSSLAYANGRLRLHLLGSAALGCFVFLFTAGRPLNRMLRLLAGGLRGFFSKLLQPFRTFFSLLQSGVRGLASRTDRFLKAQRSRLAALFEKKFEKPKKRKKSS